MRKSLFVTYKMYAAYMQHHNHRGIFLLEEDKTYLSKHWE